MGDEMDDYREIKDHVARHGLRNTVRAVHFYGDRKKRPAFVDHVGKAAAALPDDGKGSHPSHPAHLALLRKHGLRKVVQHLQFHTTHEPAGEHLRKALKHVDEADMTDDKKPTLAESVRRARGVASRLPDAASIEEAEVIHFHQRGAAIGSIHRWKTGLFRKTQTGWQELPAPANHTPASVPAAPSKAEVPAAQAHQHNAHVEPAAKAPEATRHEPVAEPVPANKAAAPSKPASTGRVHAGVPHPAPEGIDPVRGPWTNAGGSLVKHAEWDRALKPGHEVEARWHSGDHMGGHRARGVVTKLNANSVRVRLSHPVGMDLYGSGLHGYLRGKEVTIPRFAGTSLASMARFSHTAGVYPVSDKTPDADLSTHTHGVFVTPKHGIDAGKKRLRQTFASKEAAEGAAAKANGRQYNTDAHHVEALATPVLSLDVPPGGPKVHAVTDEDGTTLHLFDTEREAREKADAMSTHHKRRFTYKPKAQADADLVARDARWDADYAGKRDALAKAQAAAAAPPQLAQAAPASPVNASPAKAQDAGTPPSHQSAGAHGIPPLPPISAEARAKTEAQVRSYGREFDPAKDFSIQQPEDLPLTVAPKPAEVPQDLHDKLVSFAHHVRAADAADLVSGGFTHEVHKDSHHIRLHYKRGHAYVDVGTSGRYMIPTEPGKGKWEQHPVGTVHAIRAYGQKHPFYTRGNVLDDSAQAKLAKDYDSVVKNAASFRGVKH